VPYLAQPIDAVRMYRNRDLRRIPSMLRYVPVWFSRPLLLAAALVGALLVALVVPPMRVVLVAAVIVEMATAVAYRLWNGPWLLRARLLPPGRRSVLFTSQLDHDHFRRRWQRYGPVFTSNAMYTPMVAVGGLELGTRVLREHADALHPVAFVHSDWVAGGAVRNQRGDRHRQSRTVFSRALAPRSLEPARPEVETIVARHLARWAAEADERDAAELRRAVDELVLDAFVLLLFGVSHARDAAVHARVVDLVGRYHYMSEGSRDHHPDDLLAVVLPLASEPSQLSPSCLRALAERSPAALEDRVITTNIIHMLHITRYDVSGLVTWLLHELATHPEWVERVRAAGADAAVAAWVVSETLRLSQSEFVLREVECPIAVEGYDIPAGWWLRVLVRESHRDPSVFADAERFDPSRFGDGLPPRTQYSPFGLDGHSCVGEALTRLLGSAFVSVLCAGYDLVAASDGPPVFNEHYHWAPSRSFRARLVAIDPVARPATIGADERPR
jgi:cytochrome P450